MIRHVSAFDYARQDSVCKCEQLPFLSTGQSKPYVAEKVLHAANQLISSCFKKFSIEAIITAGFVSFKLQNGNDHLFPVWWCYWGSIVQIGCRSVWPIRRHFLRLIYSSIDSSLLMVAGQNILQIIWRHLFTKV